LNFQFRVCRLADFLLLCSFPDLMPISRLSSPRLWLRWAVFMTAMAGILWLMLSRTLPQIEKADPMRLTIVESAHLELTAQTMTDLQPDFTQSFSDPLERMIPHRMDGLVQPLWPWLAAWMHDPLDVAATLRGTGMFRLGLVLGFLTVLGLVAARSFSLPAALWVVLMAALHGFAPVLPFFTGEVIFHIALLALWLGCLYALQRNSLWVYGVIGAAGAMAWLAEDRLVIPMLLVFIFVSSLRAIWGWASAHFHRMPGTSLWVWRNHWLGLLMLTTMFFFISGPRLVESNAQFGEAFFSHVDHARWLSTAGEGMHWIEQHPDAESIARVPVLDRPSAASAMGMMTLGRMLGRLYVGAGLVSEQLDAAIPMLMAMLLLLVSLTVLTWSSCPKATHAGERLHPETATTVLFVTVAIGICTVIAFWDAVVLPIRHLHGLVMLLSLSMAWGAESVLRRARRRGVSKWVIGGYLVLMWVLVGWAALTPWA